MKKSKEAPCCANCICDKSNCAFPCYNPGGCPCHTKKTPKQEEVKECHCGKDGHALNSINCPVHGTIPEKGWEDVFDESFCDIKDDEDNLITSLYTKKRIKDFIRQELSSQRERESKIVLDCNICKKQEMATICETCFIKLGKEAHHKLLKEIKEMMPKGVKELLCPRSFGDGEIVNQAFGYNQAISEFESLLKELEQKLNP